MLINYKERRRHYKSLRPRVMWLAAIQIVSLIALRTVLYYPPTYSELQLALGVSMLLTSVAIWFLQLVYTSQLHLPHLSNTRSYVEGLLWSLVGAITVPISFNLLLQSKHISLVVNAQVISILTLLVLGIAYLTYWGFHLFQVRESFMYVIRAHDGVGEFLMEQYSVTQSGFPRIKLATVVLLALGFVFQLGIVVGLSTLFEVALI